MAGVVAAGAPIRCTTNAEEEGKRGTTRCGCRAGKGDDVIALLLLLLLVTLLFPTKISGRAAVAFMLLVVLEVGCARPILIRACVGVKLLLL